MVMTRPPAYHPGNFLMKNMNPTNSGLIYKDTLRPPLERHSMQSRKESDNNYKIVLLCMAIDRKR